MADQTAHAGELRPAPVFRDVGAAIARHGGGMLVLSFVFVSVPTLASALLTPAAAKEASVTGYVIAFALGLPSAMIQACYSAWWARLVWKDRHGADTPAAPVGASLVLYVLATSVLTQLGTTIGTLALLVPGAIFALSAFVSVPAAAIEGLGPVRAISRSFALTRGRKTALLGIALLYIVPTLAVSEIGQEIITGWAPLTVSNADTNVVMIWRPLVFAPFALLLGALSAVVYRNLATSELTTRP